MTPRPLLAKSGATGAAGPPSHSRTLAGHLIDTAEVAATLLEVRLDEMLDIHRLPGMRWRTLFRAALLRAAGIHDIGKANDQFQSLVRGTHTVQALRHEAVALAILGAFPQLDGWLFAGLDPQIRLATLRSVAGHHLKFDLKDSFQPRATGSALMHVYAAHPDFHRSLKTLGELIGASAPPPPLPDLQVPLWKRVSAVPDPAQASEWWDTADGELRRFSAALAAMLIAADVAASAAGKNGERATVWVPQALRTGGTQAEFTQAGQQRLAGRPLRPFQQAVASASADAILATAGCGTGKTTAAWLWAANRVPGKKLFFCYPTTGTATEGFFNYPWPELGGEAGLLHSRAGLDVQQMLCNGDDDVLDIPKKLDALTAWGAKTIVCTVDTVLGLIQNYRSGLFGYPAFAGAGFVFDEIHLYDRKLFGALLRFLELFPGSPVLLMTASLQTGRRAAIRAAAESGGRTLAEVPGPPELEHLKRYIVNWQDRVSAQARALQTAREGGRVLWVANTVGRAIETADALASRGANVLRYHSRYRYLDRLRHHQSVLHALGPGAVKSAGVIAVTTQVCEVSLDVSADLLVSELAPAPSLIQRCGRLNRWALPEQSPPALPAVVIEAPSDRPYESEDMVRARQWLDRVTGRPVSQSEFSQALELILSDELTALPEPSRWADFGWNLRRDSVREDGVTASFVREEDFHHCVGRSGEPSRQEIAKYSIPMTVGPVVREIASWRNLAHQALVAPAGRIDYDPERGAKWRGL